MTQCDLYCVLRPAFPPFPHTALAKLLSAFPPSFPGKTPLSLRAMGRLMIILLPKLLHASFWEWVLLSERFKEAVHGPLAVPLVRENLDDMRKDAPGLLGYAVRSIAHTDPYTVRIVFTALDCR